MQGRVADVAVARAGEECGEGLEPVREPEADPLAGPEPGVGEGIGHRVDPAMQFRVGQPPGAVADREGLRPQGRMAREQRI
jgi:hypothetical protein